MIRHAYISGAIRGLGERLRRRWGLERPRRRFPVVMLGLYNTPDYRFYLRHPERVTVVWRGSDSRKVRDQVHQREARHIAISQQVHDSLKGFGVQSEIVPVTGVPLKKDVQPRGDKIYHYGNKEKYGTEYLDEIEQRAGIEILRTHWGLHEDISAVYRECFMGLRLTKHDGLPNTVVELGMMGRRCIYNGALPHAIPWSGVDDICESIEREYSLRHEDNTHIADDMYDYIDIGKEWLA